MYIFVYETMVEFQTYTFKKFRIRYVAEKENNFWDFRNKIINAIW